MTLAHAKFGASSSKRWLSCPGSLNLIEKAPPPAPSPYAIEGTLAHDALECVLLGRELRERTYTEEMIKCAHEAARWIKQRAKGAPYLCETRVDASSFTCEGQFGTCDAAIVEEFGTLVVVDYKYGAGVAVDPENNTQMIYYALGLSAQYHHNFNDVELVIIQPRAYHESGESIRIWECSMEELLSHIPKFKAGVEAAKQKGAILRTGEHCQFCPAAVICPALKESAMANAAIVFDDDTQLVGSVPDPTDITVPQLGNVLDACDKLDKWISAVRGHAAHVLGRGGDIEGWKLVDRRGMRKWVDEAAASEAAAFAFGSKAFTAPELLTPAQLEKVVGKEAKEFVALNAAIKSSGTTLVRDTDKRPAVRHIDAVFELVNEEKGE